MKRWQAVVAVDERSELGEGPWWDAERGRLLWVDLPRGLVRAHAPAGDATRAHPVGDPVGFVVGRRAGGYLAGTARGLVRLSDDLRPLETLATSPDLDGRRRINDGACDPAGRVLFGTVDPTRARTGTLWSLSPDGALWALVEGVGMSNGIGFSPDGRWLYFVDTLAQRVDRFAYDVATGRVLERMSLCVVPPAVGLPDGLAVDVDGCLWLAIWGAGAVWRIGPDGERIGVVDVAAPLTASCAFGAERRDRLYITTARGDGAGPPAGAVFAVDVGVRGAEVFAAAL
jgi:sugar lactone lactonase YvrE